MRAPGVVHPLLDPQARSAELAGAKAATIAAAAATGFPTVPGFVITTAAIASGLEDESVLPEVRRAYDDLIGDDLIGVSAAPLVVRSSSTIEDAATSSMAGRFTSVLDVVGWDAFVNAVHRVVDSAESVVDVTGVARPIAVLVQRQLSVSIGGVLFGVDPVTGNREHVVVEAVAGRPDVLVGGTALADHYVLSRRGRTVRTTRQGAVPALHGTLRRALARMARRAERVFGAPQDIEWCVDTTGRLWMLQSRPVTAVASGASGHSVVLGPGPVAETFPARLRRLEADLWIRPLRDGVARALLTAGAASDRALAGSPIVTTVNGWAVVDLELFGLADGRTTLRRRINPAVIVRRLGAAWRVGRLRVALPAMADAIVSSVDRDLAAIPRLDEVATGGLVDLLERARRELATVHSHEVLAGMLLDRDATGPSAAALAAWALHDAHAAGWNDDEIVTRAPVVLALSPPSLDTAPRVPRDMVLASGDAPSIDDLGNREALRLRARWLQELEARLAQELGRRLVDEGALPDELLLGELGLAELLAVAGGGPPPSDLPTRRDGRDMRTVPTAFRLSVSGEVRPAGHSSPTGRRHDSAGLPAGGGRAIGAVVHHVPVGQPAEAPILVTRHLEPQLAPVLGRLAGLVSETGSALSHLAILAREVGLPTVVGVPDAIERFPPGTNLEIDGATGEIEVLERAAHRLGAEPDALAVLR